MPTTRPRHQIKETDDVAVALDLAARRWPDRTRSDLVRLLVHEGALRLAESPAERTFDIELALKGLTELQGSYPPGLP